MNHTENESFPQVHSPETLQWLGIWVLSVFKQFSKTEDRLAEVGFTMQPEQSYTSFKSHSFKQTVFLGGKK